MTTVALPFIIHFVVFLSTDRFIFFCTGLLSVALPAGPGLPSQRQHRPSGLQAAGGHLGTLHQRMFLLPGPADGSERGDRLHKKCTQTHRLTRTNPEGSPRWHLKVSFGLAVLLSGGLHLLCWEKRPLSPICLSDPQVFFATLSNLQMKSCLADVDSWRLFANLNELCLVGPRDNQKNSLLCNKQTPLTF